MLEWGLELQVTAGELRTAASGFAPPQPVDRADRIEAIYHLVHMICLDNVVDDVELEVASLYAQELGFPSTIVADVLKSIVTADGDGVIVTGENIRQQVIEILQLRDE